MQGSPDRLVLQRATAESRVLLTRNVGDFRALHEAGEPHAGLLGIFFDADPKKDLSDAAIVQAITNLEAAGVPITGEFHAVNAWSW